MAATDSGERSTMVVEFRTAEEYPSAESAEGAESPEANGGVSTVTCVRCGSTGRVSEHEMAVATGVIDGIRRNVKCNDCANPSERRIDVTT